MAEVEARWVVWMHPDDVAVLNPDDVRTLRVVHDIDVRANPLVRRGQAVRIDQNAFPRVITPYELSRDQDPDGPCSCVICRLAKGTSE